MTGDQTGIVGQKNFQTLSFGTLATNNLLPLTRGTANQILEADGAGNLAFVSPTAVTTALSENVVNLPGVAAINTEFNTATVTVATDETVLVEHAGIYYLYTGAAGAPVAASTLLEFSPTGEANTLAITQETGAVEIASTFTTVTKTGADITLRFDNVNEPTGLVQLDATGLVPVANLPFSNPLQFQGGHDASANTLPALTGNSLGDAWTITAGNAAALNLFITLDGTVNVSATQLISPGDLIIFDPALNVGGGGYWLIVGVSSAIAGAIGFTPVGSITSTDVQAAIAELDTDLTAVTADAAGHLDSTPTASQALDQSLTGQTTTFQRSGTATTGDPVVTLAAGQVNVIRGDGATANQLDSLVLSCGNF